MKLVVAMLLASASVWAAPLDRAARRVRVGTQILQNRMESESAIPKTILDGARCVATVRVVKAALLLGGEGSAGLVSCRTKDGWSSPSFLNVGGASVGIQIGVQIVDSVLVFMTDESRKLLSTGTIQLGVDMTATLGPDGEGVGAGAIPNAHVFTYNRAAGAFAGINVNGLIVGHAPLLNTEVYGHNTPVKILATPADRGPKVGQAFAEALKKHAN